MLATVFALSLLSMCNRDRIDLRSMVPVKVEEPRPNRAPLELVLDTSVFTDPTTAVQFGNTTGAAFAVFIQLLERVRGDAPVPPRFELVISVPRFLPHDLMQLAEKAVRETIQEDVEPTIARLRDEYREALCTG